MEFDRSNALRAASERGSTRKTDDPALSGRPPSSNSLDCFISSAAFDLPDALVPSAWTEHAPFAFWLVEILRPAVFVELGTFRGFSYLAVCQAVKRLGLDTRCYAVDTWRGDEHNGFYADEVLEELKRYHDPLYADFSTLLRATFDEALHRFGPKSIDLIHIDGRHFYEDVKHDFESWRDKLSENAVVLFHDINVRENGFGVHRYWKEISACHPHFAFDHGYGLGVMCVGTVNRNLAHLFEASADPIASIEINRLYSSLGERLAWKARAGEVEARDSEMAELHRLLSSSAAARG